MAAHSIGSTARVLGRYELHAELAAGGMATVHLGRLLGEAGFVRTIAIKRLHPQYAKDPEFVAMFLDEARLAARIRHPNVVPTLDVVSEGGEIFLVMEYVQGESLARLLRTLQSKKRRVPPHIATTLLGGVLHGLHAAHEAKNEKGVPLEIVHRDVSPQNVLVGVDGIAHVLDFGVAKAIGRAQTTREGQLKGKLAYMAPEQLEAGTLTRQTDVYAAAVVLWETLTGRRLFEGDNEGAILMKVMEARIGPPSGIVRDLPHGIDEVVLRGLARDPRERWATARDFALALEKCARVAPPSEVGEWVQEIAGEELSRRAKKVTDIERGSIRAPAAEEIHIDDREATRDSSGVRGAEVVSQVSSISVSKSEKAAPPAATPPPSRVGFIVGGLAATLLSIVLIFVLARSSGARPVMRTAALAPQPTSSPAQEPLPSPSPPAPLPAASASDPVSVPAPSASSLDAVDVTTIPRVDEPKPPRPAGASSEPKAPAPYRAARPHPDCDPPFTRDALGHKHYKLQCL